MSFRRLKLVMPMPMPMPRGRVGLLVSGEEDGDIVDSKDALSDVPSIKAPTGFVCQCLLIEGDLIWNEEVDTLWIRLCILILLVSNKVLLYKQLHFWLVAKALLLMRSRIW